MPAIYRFKSKSDGDVVMMAPVAEELLRLIGKEPAAQGIIEAAALPEALHALGSAMAQSEAQDASVAARPTDPGSADDAPDDDAVALNQRAWPLVEMMKRAQAEGHHIVWGV